VTHRVGADIVFCAEAPARCESCGTFAELRPYGPGGIRICHACGKKDPDGTRERMRRALGLEES
jgi:hypothetical protein